MTLKPTQLQQRRKRRQEETGKSFRLLALNVMRRVVLSIFNDPAFWYAPDDIHDRHAEAERLYRLQTEEWPNEDDDAQEHDSGFHYGTAASFDPHP